MVRHIAVTGGDIALVDDEDYCRASSHHWHMKNGYAATKINGMTVLMHRLILGATPKQKVNRTSSDRLDNRRSNIELAGTYSTIKPDSALRAHNKSGYNGVSWSHRDGAWRAQITVKGRTIRLGRFDDAEMAAMAFDEAALMHRGERARLNFPDEVNA